MTRSIESPINDFSIMIGGPLHRLFVATRLATPDLGFRWRRAAALAGIAWLPLLVLTALDGRLLADTVRLPFLHDLEAHVRLLVVIPLIVLGERTVHLRLRSVVAQLVERGIVDEADLPRYMGFIASLRRWRDAKSVELAILALVAVVGVWLWTKQLVFGGTTPTTWYADRDGAALHLTAAGFWYAFVGIPIVQFLTCRWGFRLFLWFRFLWQVSKLRLHLNVVHADGSGGLGFLGESTLAFGPLIMAQAAMFAAMLSTRILHGGRGLLEFKYAIPCLIVAPVVALTVPLLMFSAQMVQARWRGWRNYGLLMSEYAQFFDRKWLADPNQSRNELLGSADIQSLADLGSGYQAAREMGTVPVSRGTVKELVIASAIPYAPLALTVLPFDELVKQLLELII